MQPEVLDLGLEAELVGEAAAPASARAPRPVPAPPAAAPDHTETTGDRAIAEIDGMAEEQVEIPQIDALDDIDSILDQLEEKG